MEEEEPELPVELPKEPGEETQLGQDLQNGKSKIINYPKTEYRAFEQVDLRGIEIISKSYDGTVNVSTYDDVVSNPGIHPSVSDGDYLPTQFYTALLGSFSIQGESQKTRRAIEKYFTIDDRQFVQDRALLMAKVQSQVVDSLTEPILGSSFNLTKFARSVTKPTEPQSTETYVTLSGGNNLFIPVIITNAGTTQSLDRYGDLAVTEVIKTPSGDRNIFKFKLDVRDLSILKELDLKFTDRSSGDIQVRDILESDGFNRRYIRPGGAALLGQSDG